MTEYDPVFFLMPALLNSASIGLGSNSPSKKNPNKSGVFQTLEQIISSTLHNEDLENDEFDIQASGGTDLDDRPKSLKQLLLGSSRLQRSIQKVCEVRKLDAI